MSNLCLKVLVLLAITIQAWNIQREGEGERQNEIQEPYAELGLKSKKLRPTQKLDKWFKNTRHISHTRKWPYTTKLQKSWHYVLCTCCVANTAWRSYSLVPISKVGLSLTWHIEPFRTKFGSVLFGFEKKLGFGSKWVWFGSVKKRGSVRIL